jgi:hypothetical protein
MILDGFGPSPEGEDPFDATVGLMGMLKAILADKTAMEPDDRVIRKIEGWIFGQEWAAGSGLWSHGLSARRAVAGDPPALRKRRVRPSGWVDDDPAGAK